MKFRFRIENRKTVIFLVCLGISSVMWLLIKLSKEYELIVNIPVRFSNFPNDKILINYPDSTISIKVTDNGFDLIGTSIFGNPDPLLINIEGIRQIKITKNKSKSFILTRSYYQFFESQFSSAKNIELIEPDSIIFLFEKQASKKVRISPQYSVKFPPQYQLNGKPIISPDSITIFGSAIDIHKIDSIRTEFLEFKNLETSVDENVKIILPSKIKSSISEVQLQINVEKFTEASIQIPLTTKFASKKQVRIFPNQIQIKYAVSLENFNNIKAEQFQVIGEADSLSVGKLNIILKEFPANIRIIDFSPRMAEFIIIK